MSDGGPAPLVYPGAAHMTWTFIELLSARLAHCARAGGAGALRAHGLRARCVRALLGDARDALRREDALQLAHVPAGGRVHALGDVHGDVFSVRAALRLTGAPAPGNRVVFVGDLVDRGPWGVEVLLLVLALKVWQPDNVFVLRGNHETAGCMENYNFAPEATAKYSDVVYRDFLKTVTHLPIALLLHDYPPTSTSTTPTTPPPSGRARKEAKKAARAAARRAQSSSSSAPPGAEWPAAAPPGGRRVLLVHGGLWRDPADRGRLGGLRHLRGARRADDDPAGGVVEDALWSDPGARGVRGVRENALRGAGVLFGAEAAERFLREEGVHLVVRAHEGPDVRRMPERGGLGDMMGGWEVDLETGAGAVATLFSCARYVGMENKGAVATFHGWGSALRGALPQIRHFDSDRPLDAQPYVGMVPARPVTPRSF